MKDTSLAVCLLAVALAAQAGAQTQVDLRTQAKNVDFSAATSTKPFRTGTLLPGTCSVGETFFKTDAAAGQNLFACTAANTWTLEGGASGIPSMPGNANRVLSTDGTTADWRALGGDLNGAPQAATVTGIQGRPIGSLAPADGQVLRWSNADGQWKPALAPAAGGVNYSQTFSSQTSVSMLGSAHGLGTANLIVDCYNNASPARRIEADSISVDPSTFDVTVAFTNSQSGRCVINGSGSALAARIDSSNVFASGTTQTFQGALVATSSDRTAPAKAGTSPPASCSPGDQFFKTNAAAGQNLYFCTAANTWTQMSGNAPVASVFGRTGAVGAQVGDYSFSQIAGTVADAQLATGINANRIGDGTVTNTVWGRLANVSSDVQAQLDGKAPTAHSHALGGDLSGTTAGATVTKIQSLSVSSSAPADGQALVWSAGSSAWQPGTVSGGGAGMGAQLGDFAVVRGSPNLLTIGANCSSTTPCNARFGSTVYSFTHSCTATLSAGTGTAFVYVAGGGTLTIGHNLALAASAGCLAQPSVTAFPADSIPLYNWTATSGTWDVAGGKDFRGWLGQKNLSAGTGIATMDSGGRTTVGIDTAVVPTYLTTTVTLNFPLIANGACAADQSFSLLGAVVGDSVAPGWPGAFEPGLLGIMRVSAADTIAIRVCNLSGAAMDPINATFRATIVRSF
ncbi:MAG: hypothetical protein ABSE56_14350 [Bryobacteraceae bacterium]|jgi:hypothetical protein